MPPRTHWIAIRLFLMLAGTTLAIAAMSGPEAVAAPTQAPRAKCATGRSCAHKHRMALAKSQSLPKGRKESLPSSGGPTPQPAPQPMPSLAIPATPATPSLTASNPPSPNSSTTPLIIGDADHDAIVKLYTNSSCSGTAVASGSGAALATPGLGLAVPPGSQTTIYASATNAAGTTSGCSNGFSYTSSVGATPPTGSSRFVYCLGDPQWTHGMTSSTHPEQIGWWFDSTSTAWSRQYPQNYSQRVSFDDSVGVGALIGCHSVRNHLDPTDTDTNGVTGERQRADVFLSDAEITKANEAPTIYPGGQPLLGDARGNTTYYGYAFQTSNTFVVKPPPDWQVFQDWHASTIACASTCYIDQQPIELDVSTVGMKTPQCRSGTATYADGQPHLVISINGGNADDPNWRLPTATDATCLRYNGPDFIPGHTYRVIYKMTWGDHGTGAAQVWIDGVQYVNVSGINTMIYSAATGQQASVYMKFTNYRKYDTSYPPQDVWFSGLVKGSTLSDVTIP